jgi:subfamily B ATP-binding cassette protein MsbA
MIDPGKVVGLVIGMDTINQGFRSLGSVANTFATVQAASERIHTEVLERDEEPELVGGRILDNPKGHIQFENVSFRYSDGTEALKNVSFEILPDTSLALVGPSGAGKSTIADLLLRFYDPTSGRILLDGVDIRELNITWLRGLVGVVPQQTFLFNGTVEENVRLGAPSASDEDLDKALEQASAKDFVTELSTRSNSELGERGIRLSGGQMQRVAIARALIKRPTILLLDEATSALDANSEKAVTQALEEVMRSRTTLFIAHRLTTAARADRILVLSKGEVLETGSHAELLKANSTYAALFRAFSGGVLS